MSKNLLDTVSEAITPRLYDRMDEYAIKHVARIAVKAAFQHARDNISQQQIADGWAQLRRAHLPHLGAGPGLQEAYRAMITTLLAELDNTK